MKIFLSIILFIISTNGAYAASTQHNKYCKSDCTYEFNMFRKFAKKDSGLAQYMMGVMLIEGQGTEKNITSGLRYIKRAALKKEPSAEYQLGYFYLYGIFTDQNLDKADVFLSRAKKNRVPMADKHLKVLTNIKTNFDNNKANIRKTPLLVKQHETQKTLNKPMIEMEVINVFAGLNYSDIIYAAEQQVCKNGWGKMKCEPFSNSAFVPFFEVKGIENKFISLYM